MEIGLIAMGKLVAVGNGDRDGEGGSDGEGGMGVVMRTVFFCLFFLQQGIKVCFVFLLCFLFFKIIHLLWFLTSPLLHSDLHRSAQLINIGIYCRITLD